MTRDGLRTLLLHATGAPRWSRVVVDTLTGGRRLPTWLFPHAWRRSRYVRFVTEPGYSALSYVLDWKEAFCQAPALRVDPCNVTNLAEFRAGLRRLAEYDLVIILHSAAGDCLTPLRWATRWFQGRRGALVMFPGNEYASMRDKIAFARAVRAEYIASQLPLDAATWLYAQCEGSRVLSVPGALNPAVYRPGPRPRPIDIGFRGDLYGISLGDVERTQFLRRVQADGQRWGVATDIAFERVPRDAWGAFLNACKGIVGAEGGTYYLERDDRTQRAVARYLRWRPGAPFEDIYDRFFAKRSVTVSGKAISARHFEPVGTKTCQLLLEGRYSDLLVPDEHYIAVTRDLANLDDAVARFRDATYRQAMVERTYQYVLDQHTYRHRVDAVLTAVLG
ncbi:MAG: glycosyltransferase family protein [Candidatus Rokuibacteriota bacterium]